MNWLLPHPLLPYSVKKLSFSLSLSVSLLELTDGNEGARRWGRSQSIRRRESIVLYKSFNTLCHIRLDRQSTAV
jgi:hypothetical protein